MTGFGHGLRSGLAEKGRDPARSVDVRCRGAGSMTAYGAVGPRVGKTEIGGPTLASSDGLSIGMTRRQGHSAWRVPDCVGNRAIPPPISPELTNRDPRR